MPPPVKLSLFYDITSPWSYIAFEALRRYTRPWNLQLDLRPMFLGAVHLKCGNQAPASVPNKAKWMADDLDILAQLYSLDMKLPPGFPFNKEYNTLNVMRFMRVLRMHKPEVLEEATKRLYEEFFSRNTPTASPAFLGSLSSPPALLTPDELTHLTTLSQSAENKALLRSEAEALADEGAFGFPWIVLRRTDGGEHSFFGSDRMQSISFWLGKEYPYVGVDPEGLKSRM
ncbi:thioredoxin-like protein [Dacryopinax primogenitus]|uniref:Glutathione S-transferase kappa n=1 Tax=Dacryopinax primogenitus (strain DJM 731) TaxID=1858805 RepID=M5FQJ8_DACPD|nr:thioredoxin-like protein [Dacryopinax primogenitus]EJT97019.1 thioredoxin-like protein [Dacryopinax primogenitus]